MANIILSDDYGEYIEVDEVAYVRVGAVLGTPANATVGAGDHLNVAAYEWFLDADNDEGGTNHKTWTAEEYAVAHIDALNNQAELNGETAVPIFTAPEDGELRLWNEDSANGFYVIVNDLMVVDAYIVTNNGYLEVNAVAVRLAKDDVVEISANPGRTDTIACKFCPDIYPY